MDLKICEINFTVEHPNVLLIQGVKNNDKNFMYKTFL